MTDAPNMQKSLLFIIVAAVFCVLGFSFAKYCPLGSRFGPASAQASSLNAWDSLATSSQLQSDRALIELYKQQHNDTYPDFRKYGWKQLTYKTNAKGQISEQDKEIGSALFGPYFTYGPPQNPLTRSSEVLVVPSITEFKATGTYGFVFAEDTGKFFALAPDGKIFDEPVPTSAQLRRDKR